MNTRYGTLAAVTTAAFIAGALLVPRSVPVEAQGDRPVVGSTARLTDTSANALLVGCAQGSTSCTGGIKAGPFSFLRTGLSAIRDGVLGSSAGIELHIRPASGKKAYITITEDTVADRWSVGTENGDDKLYFRSGLYTDAADAWLESSGGLYFGGRLMDGDTQSVSTVDGTQTVTLDTETRTMRLTAGGSGTDDTISTLNGGTGGRNLRVCWVAEEDSGDGPIDLSFVAGGGITLTLGACNSIWFDGTSSTWRRDQ